MELISEFETPPAGAEPPHPAAVGNLDRSGRREP